MAENPHYYAIIPAKVRYDKELCLGARMLYGEITALCNKEGYCWATNKYFAELYAISIGTASVWINSLVKKGYISSEIIYDAKQVVGRHLRIVLIEQGGPPKIQDTPNDNSVHNNNNINNKKEITNNTKVLLTQSVSKEEPIRENFNTKDIKREDIDMLFSLPKKELPDYTSLPANHRAVQRYITKVSGKEILPVKSFTNTDWLLTFVLEYNKAFDEAYILPPMGATFNGLIEPFSRLIRDVPLENRILVFAEFIAAVKKGNRLPYTWVGGFTFEQMSSGYNHQKVREEFKRISEYISLDILDAVKTVESKASNVPIQYF